MRVFFYPSILVPVWLQFLLSSILMKTCVLFLHIEMSVNSIKKPENCMRLNDNIEIALVHIFQFEDGEP